MNPDPKDEIIAALQEMMQEFLAKLVNLRVASGLKIRELEAKLAELTKNPAENGKAENGKSAMKAEDFETLLDKH
jgi:hypothetical protein